jgi:hypothetical protein
MILIVRCEFPLTARSGQLDFIKSMDRFHRFVGKHFPEILALSASLVVLSVGTELAFSSNPVWLNRTGSLIVIIGIILAASRFHEWIAQQVINSIELNPETFSMRALDIYERKNGKTLSDDDRAYFLLNIKKLFEEKNGDQQWYKTQIMSLIEPDKRRLKLYEIYLVVIGTFLNGFGDYIVTMLKSHGF